VREQIAAACEDKKGTIEAAAVIERDLTGDGKNDLIISRSVMIYVRRGALLKLAVDDLLGAKVAVGNGKVPEIRMYALGGTLHSLKWNGREFRGISTRVAGPGNREGGGTVKPTPAPSQQSPREKLVGAWAPVPGTASSDGPDLCAGDMGIQYSADGTYDTLDQVGTWRLEGETLTETATEATDAAEPGSVKIGRPLASRIQWQGPDTLVLTGADGQQITLRRCPPAGTASPDFPDGVMAAARQYVADCRAIDQPAHPVAQFVRSVPFAGGTAYVIDTHHLGCTAYCGSGGCTIDS
jgi:hypothetical protein